MEEVGPSAAKLGRNNPCPCGGGKKFKKRELEAISIVLSDARRFEIRKRIASHDCAACAELRYPTI
jgi:hypothetical protein